ncbi:MAG: DoxX family protein [Chloroflexota bacterium]
MAGHGAQKLFGAFEGPGLKGTAGFMEALGLTPGHLWGTAAALSEFGGGSLTALGLLHPLGSIATVSAMTMATATAHKDKPIWVTAGGAELPITNISAAVALMFTGPGAYSLDHALGIKLPKAVAAAAMLGAAAMIGYGLIQQPAPPEAAKEEARTTVQGGEDASNTQLS